MKAYGLNLSIIPQTLKDSINDLIGRHINQSAMNGKYLDIPTMGEYLELLSLSSGSDDINFPIRLKVNIFPNPTSGFTNLAFNVSESDSIILSLYNLNGQLLKSIDQGQEKKGTYSYQIDLSTFPSGVYVLTLQTNKRKCAQKIIKSE